MGRGKFLRSLKQRWWILLLLVLPITLGTLLYTLMGKTKYEAFMTLADRRPTDINQTVLYDEDIMGRAVNDQEIRVLNLANTVSSYTVLKSAYDELTQQRVVDPEDTEILDFVGQVSVEPLRGTEYLQVSYVDQNPEDARQVIDTIYAKFMARYRQLTTEITQERSEFIAKQLADAQAAYDATLQKQMEFQEKNPGGIAYEVNTSGLVAQLGQAKQRLWEADRNLAVAQGQAQTAQQQIERMNREGDSFVTQQQMLNPVWNEIDARIASNNSTLTGLRETYGPKHPRVIAIQKSIDEDRALLAKTDHYLNVGTTPGVSPVKLDSIQARNTAQRAIDASRQEKRNAEATIAKLTRDLDRLPVVQKELSGLQAELTAQNLIVSELTKKLSESKVREAQSQSPTIYMLDDPIFREVPRNTALKTLIALFLSSIVAISLIASLGQVDQGTYTPVEAENSLGFPVIAMLPKSSQQRLSTGAEQATALAASYQILSTEIMAIKDKLQGPGILVAAAEPDSGRTTVAANLAISLARDGARVLLIDSDLRTPALHSHFGLENRAGLSEILQGSATVENVVQPTGVEGLLLITAGQPPVNPVKLFHGEALDQFVDTVSKGADFIVFDSPAGSTFGDAAVLAMNVQNVVLVHEAGRAPSVAEYEFHKSLERLGVNIVGMVLNKARPDDCPAYQHFRKNYESKLGDYRPGAAPAALGSGGKPTRANTEQYGTKPPEDEE
jgi:capsular exopolysaccharide synthesis family protein